MTFQQELEQETIGSLPLRDVIAVRPYTLLRAAIALMKHHSLGCAVIVDQARRPVGIFTEHSVIDALTKHASLDYTPVAEFTDPNFVVVQDREPILRVWEAVQSAAARFVCVTDREGHVIGLTGQRGLAEYVTDCFAREVTVQRLGATPWLSQREGA